MPRNYGRIATSVWRDEDFVSLTAPARFTYLMLVTQPDVSAAGVLPVTRRRWSKAVALNTEQLDKALSELQDRAYVVLDEDTEELLVRSFVRWDGGAGNDKRRRAILDATRAVASRDIVATLARELARAGIPYEASKPHPPVDNQAGDAPSIGHRSPTDTPRVVVNTGDHQTNPQPATSNPHPQPGSREPSPSPSPAASGNDPAPRKRCTKHPDGYDHDEPCRHCAADRAWDEANPNRERQRIAAERRDCTDCDDNGMVLDPTTALPVHRCTHPRLRRPA